jgi:hypothetical protein
MRLLELLNEDDAGKPQRGPAVTSRPPMEFGKSRPLEADPAAALPNPRVITQLRNTDTYMQYRYGIALAAAAANRGPDANPDFEQESAWGENIGMVGYTDQDVEQIKDADKLMDVQSQDIGNGGSHEQSDVNTKSAISGAENQ